MKNILLVAFSFFLVLNVNAQSAKKLLRKASKDFARYNQDQVGNKDKLASAIDAINQAFEIEGVSDDAGAWVKKGEIFNGISDSEMKMKIINPDFKIEKPNAPMTAFEAFKMAMEKSSKKSQTKDAVEGLKATEAHLSNMAITMFQEKDYMGAYTNFSSATSVYDMLKANKADSRLDDEKAMTDHTFYTAISGYYAEKGDEVEPLFKKLFDQGSGEAVVYEALYSIHNKRGDKDAVNYLSEGRKKFPENTALLFSEINHYLAAGELNKLIDKLETAIQAEPDNVSVINTTGNVYEQLSAKTAEAGDKEKSDMYYDKAKEYYSQAISKEPNNFDANYSLGALYYNKAAGMVEKINEYAQDYTPAGTKKYEEANKEMMGFFEHALPYFEKSYELKPDDVNTMIALKEIYVRQSNMDKANEIKAKLGQ